MFRLQESVGVFEDAVTLRQAKSGFLEKRSKEQEIFRQLVGSILLCAICNVISIRASTQ